jgi:cell division protein FtsZ
MTLKMTTLLEQPQAIEFTPPALESDAENLITPVEIDAAGETLVIPEWESQDAVIKVIGVGGAGCNALNILIDQGVQGVEFIAIDNYAQDLTHSKAGTHLQVGATDESREADRAQIARLINDANMVVIVAGMGGATGTPVVSLVGEIARQLNLLTIAVVTSPAGSEVNLAPYAAERIRTLHENVDTLIVVPLDDLMRMHSVSMPEAIKIANGVMRDAVAGVVEIVNVPGLVGIDFADVRTVMSEKGSAMVGTGGAAGPDRARLAAERAVASPLFKNMNLSDALGLLVTITSTSSLKLKELDEVMDCMKFAAKDAGVIIGALFDESMGDEMRVTVVATGLGLTESVYRDRRAASLVKLKEMNEMFENIGNGAYDIPDFLRK